MVPTLKTQTEAKWNLGRNECLHKVWEQFNLSGSFVRGILPAMEWVAIPFPGDLPNPGMESASPALQTDSLPSEPAGKT